MNGSRRIGCQRDAGSFTVELVVLTPVVIVFVLLAVAFGRFEQSHEEVIGAARAAAAAASVVPTADDAQSAAVSAATPIVESQTHSCEDLSVTTDTTDFFPGGSVQVSVSCQVDFSDVLIPGMPGGTVVRATVRAPIDPFRSTQ